MSNMMILLQTDHGYMAKVLDVIQLQATNLVRGAPVNHRLLESVFAYLSGYPDQCHHPKEELVYRKLLGRCPDMAESLDGLVGEHEKLARLTENLSQAISESRQGRPGVGERLASQLDEFLECYRQHMSTEEQQFFPAALQLLSHDDFEEIDFTLFDQADPLFNSDTEARFAELRDEILRMGAAERIDADTRDESAWVAALRDIGAFNEAMRQLDGATCLTPASDGGFDLEHQGKILVHIPECNESRAAWCAYFFWKGAAPIQGERRMRGE
jgi:hemerythrin-like domain-containing protein